ncbi:signal recognition particle-docking protein FtsY [Maricaulaceae bacterium NA33B04]|nr:signal recognition particle-docking protein FtsY [Maricaulaceae bacterium NA33B04]
MSWFKFGFGEKKKDKPEEAEAETLIEDVSEGAVEADATVADDTLDDSHDEVAVEADEPTDVDEAPSAEPVATSEPEPEPETEPTGDVTSDTAPEPEPVIEAAPVPAPELEPDAEPDAAPNDGVSEGTEKKGFFARIASGLKKTSSRFSDSVSAVFTQRKLDNDALEELEDLLIAADLGAATAARVTARLAKDKFDKDITPEEIKEALADVVAETLEPYAQPLDMSGDNPRIVLFVGVNGSGKTTTLGKIAVKMTREGANVVTAAGDTFRAAAVEQLEVWSKRAGATFLSRPIGSDAAGLAFDAVQQARETGADAVLFDTAGRLQNKTELMDELRKIVRVIRKIDDTAPHHVILVLDGTVGSNALSQAEAFMEAANVTGVIMTKLDGTAKGGALVQVAEKFKLPIHFIGIGEGEADLTAFDARAFARALAGLED